MPIVDSALEFLAAIAKIVEKKTLTASQAAKKEYHRWRKDVLPRYLKTKEKKDPGT